MVAVALGAIGRFSPFQTRTPRPLAGPVTVTMPSRTDTRIVPWGVGTEPSIHARPPRSGCTTYSSKPGYEEYVVQPDLGGLAWMEGSVPTPHGAIRVSVRDGTVTVTGPAKGSGVLVWNGEKRSIAPGATVTLSK